MPVAQDIQKYLTQNGVMPQTAQKAAAAIETKMTRAERLTEDEEELLQLFTASPGGEAASRTWPVKWSGLTQEAGQVRPVPSQIKVLMLSGAGTSVTALADRIASGLPSKVSRTPGV